MQAEVVASFSVWVGAMGVISPTRDVVAITQPGL